MPPGARCSALDIAFASARSTWNYALVPTCPACGFAGLDEEPWTVESASDEICPSCAIHFGYDDAGRRTPDFYAGWRGRWIVDGKPWFSKGRPAPSGWPT
jgi:hypothetical protein